MSPVILLAMQTHCYWIISVNLPSCPDCMYVHALCNIDDQFDVCIVVIVCSSRDLDVLICHPDIICICVQIFWCSHHRELDSSLIAESLVGPFPHRSNLLDCRNTIVGNQDLFADVSLLLLPADCPMPQQGTHICDDGVTIVTSYEVLYFAGSCILQAVSTDEVVCQIEFGSI